MDYLAIANAARAMSAEASPTAPHATVLLSLIPTRLSQPQCHRRKRRQGEAVRGIHRFLTDNTTVTPSDCFLADTEKNPIRGMEMLIDDDSLGDMSVVTDVSEFIFSVGVCEVRRTSLSEFGIGIAECLRKAHSTHHALIVVAVHDGGGDIDISRCIQGLTYLSVTVGDSDTALCSYEHRPSLPPVTTARVIDDDPHGSSAAGRLVRSLFGGDESRLDCIRNVLGVIQRKAMPWRCTKHAALQLVLMLLRLCACDPAVVVPFRQSLEHKVRVLKTCSTAPSVVHQLGSELGKTRRFDRLGDGSGDGRWISGLELDLKEATAVCEEPGSKRRRIGGGDDDDKEEEAAAQGGRCSLSRCRAWAQQREFYLSRGASAWDAGVVPFSISSNAFVAAAYAEAVRAIAMDFTTPSRREQTTTYVIEVGSGHSQFGYLMALKLAEMPPLGGGNHKIVTVLTDFNESLVEERRQLPCFQPLLEAGLVDFAVLDASADHLAEGGQARLELLYSGKILSAEDFAPPSATAAATPSSPGIIVIANYALDSLPADMFLTAPGDFGSGHGCGDTLEVLVEERDSKPKPRRRSGTSMPHGQEPRFVLSRRPVERQHRYPNNAVLSSTFSRLLSRGAGLHVVPVGFVRLLRRMRTINPFGGFAMLVGDGPFPYDDQRWQVGFDDDDAADDDDEYDVPELTPSPGCFTVPVDPDALVAGFDVSEEFHWQESGGGGGQQRKRRKLHMHSSHSSSSFQVTVLCSYGGPVRPFHVAYAFSQHLGEFSVSDFELLSGLVTRSPANGGGDDVALDTASLLSVLRFSGYDFQLFLDVRWRLREAMKRDGCLYASDGDGADKRASCVETCLRCFAHRFAIKRREWEQLRRLAAQWLFSVGAYEASLALPPSEPATSAAGCPDELYLEALCLFRLGRNGDALAAIAECQTLQKTHRHRFTGRAVHRGAKRLATQLNSI